MIKVKCESNLELERCPYCNINKPNLVKISEITTHDSNLKNPRDWKFFRCMNCGGVTTASAGHGKIYTDEIFPQPDIVSEVIPERAREYLRQALDSLHAPAGAIMLASSAIDAMLKSKGYKEGYLYPRIDKAVEDHVITESMGEWAHKVRLDANNQRHADESVALPNEFEARQVIEFSKAFAEFLFVLPSKVQKGLKESESNKGS